MKICEFRISFHWSLFVRFLEIGMDIIVTYWTFSIIFILVTTGVAGDNWCGRLGLWPFLSVAVSVCGRSGLWPFRSVAVPVCGRSGLWPFRSVAVPVCGRFGLWPFRLWPFRFVAVMTCYRWFNSYGANPSFKSLLTFYQRGHWKQLWWNLNIISGTRHSRKITWTCGLLKDGHFVQGFIC